MMRFVLAVAVLVGCAAHEDPVAIDTILLREYESNVDQSSYTTVGPGFQPQPNTPVIAFIAQTAGAANGPTLVTANGLTWTRLGGYGTTAHAIFSYIAFGPAPTPSEMQIDFAPGDVTTGVHVSVVECPGMSLYGPVAQEDGAQFSATLTTPVSLTDPLEHADSVHLYALEVAGGTNNLTPGAGFTRLSQLQHSLPGRTMATVRGQGQVDNPSWTPTSGNGAWAAVALRPKLTPAPEVQRRIIAIMGQSNAVGGARTEDATLIAPAELDADFPQVTIDEWVEDSGLGFTRYFARPLSPKNALGSFGVELSMGRALNAFFPGGNVVILKCANNGTGLDAYWKPSANQGYPIARDYFRQMEVEFGGKVEAIVWVQGNGDAKAGSSGPSDNYAENLTALFNQLKTDLGNDRLAFALDEYPFGGTFAATVRAEQIAFVQATPGTAIIEADDAPQRDDDHYAADGKILLGWRFAYVLKGLLDKPPRFRGSIAVR